jgi:hypothetical protein
MDRGHSRQFGGFPPLSNNRITGYNGLPHVVRRTVRLYSNGRQSSEKAIYNGASSAYGAELRYCVPRITNQVIPVSFFGAAAFGPLHWL